MKLAIFGATGKTGMELVKQALDGGHQVTAFVRNPAKMTITNPNLTLVQGDALDATAVEKAIVGTDAVLVALGRTADTKDAVMTKGTQHIVDAMKKSGVKRLVVESSYPMSGAPESMAFLKQMMSDEQLAPMQPMIDDKKGQEDVTRTSSVNWTLIRPLMLTDGPKTEKYRLGEMLAVKPGDSIARADVADYMLKTVTDKTAFGKTITIAS